MTFNSSIFRQFLNLFENDELNDVEEEINSIIWGEGGEEIKKFSKFFHDIKTLNTEIKENIEKENETTFYLHILYNLSALNEFDLKPFFEDLNFCRLLYSLYTSSNQELIILSAGILFNMLAHEPSFITFLNEIGFFSHLHILLMIRFDSEREKTSFVLINDYTLFKKVSFSFLRHLTHFICSVSNEIPETVYHNLWNLAFELVSENSSPFPIEEHDSLLIETSLVILCNLLSKGYKEELKDVEVQFLSQLLHENSKIINLFSDFISLYGSEQLNHYLINECDLLSGANSALEFNSNEASSAFHFLMAINYQPQVDEPIFANTISILQNKKTKIPNLISAIKFCNTFLPQLPVTEINRLIPNPPFLEISNILDENDINTLNSLLDFIHLFINETQRPTKKTFGLVKLIPALENMYGISEEIDTKIDSILQIVDQSFSKK